jgi:hypothetical protein
MATSQQINQLISALLSKPDTIDALTQLYLASDTTPKQRADIRDQLQMHQPQIHYRNLNQRSLEERIRIHLAQISLFDGQEPAIVDSRDASMTYDRFLKTVVDAAIREKTPVLKHVHEIRAISAPRGGAKIKSFENAYLYRVRESEKAAARQFRQARSAQPAQAQTVHSDPEDRRVRRPQRITPLASQDLNLDQPRRHWVSPRLRFGFATVLISIIAVIAIAQGENPPTVLLFALLFLVVVAALSWTVFNRNWRK